MNSYTVIVVESSRYSSQRMYALAVGESGMKNNLVLFKYKYLPSA